MIEKIAERIYRIGVPLPGNPLKELNSYFIRGEERDLLIDTGFRLEECRTAIKEGLEELGADAERLDILLTHLHADHAGIAGEVAGKNSRIYMACDDLEILIQAVKGIPHKVHFGRFYEEGFPADILESTYKNTPTLDYGVGILDERYVALQDGECLQAGPYTLKTIMVPGHTPGNAMYWIEDQNIMFTGDHVLFDISPNITAWRTVEDSLGNYLDSLRAVRNYPVQLALPGHRKPGDYHARIDELLEHHKLRLKEAEEWIRETPGLNAYEIAGMMRWKIRARNWEEFPAVQKRYAVGECMAHLDYLRIRGRIERRMVDGIWRYYGV